MRLWFCDVIDGWRRDLRGDDVQQQVKLFVVLVLALAVFMISIPDDVWPW